MHCLGGTSNAPAEVVCLVHCLGGTCNAPAEVVYLVHRLGGISGDLEHATTIGIILAFGGSWERGIVVSVLKRPALGSFLLAAGLSFCPAAPTAWCPRAPVA